MPGFITRKSTNHLRLENGMTFAVAGLLSDNVTYARLGIPGLGRLPLVGAFFRSVRHVRDETEVVIYVTPRLVRPLAPGEVRPPRNDREQQPERLRVVHPGHGLRRAQLPHRHPDGCGRSER